MYNAFLCAFVSLFYILSLSLAVWQSGSLVWHLEEKTTLKKKKKRKMEEEDERKKTKKQKKAKKKGAILVSVLDLFFLFFSRDRTVPSHPIGFPHKEKKRKGRAENRSRDYIYIYITMYM